MMPIRAVLFDLWGTLITTGPDDAFATGWPRLRRRMLAEALAGLGLARADEQLEHALGAAADELQAIHINELDISARGRTVLVLRHLDPSLAERIDEPAWAKLDEAIHRPALLDPPPMIDDAAATVASAKAAGLRTGLVSNAGITPGYVLRRILDDYGMLGNLDVTVFSDEAELSKPAPGIFALALDELGVEPDDAAFVGDHPLLDVYGARRAGLWAVQFGDTPSGDTPASEGEPHVRIASLPELLPALATLGHIAA